MTPLLAAAKGGSAECMELLLGLGADRCACAPGGATLLMVAAGSASAACVQLALAAGADVNARSATGDTPLGSAAAVGAAGCMQLLLAAGADACVRDKKWRCALDRVSLHGDHAEIVALLTEAARKKFEKMQMRP